MTDQVPGKSDNEIDKPIGKLVNPGKIYAHKITFITPLDLEEQVANEEFDEPMECEESDESSNEN